MELINVTEEQKLFGQLLKYKKMCAQKALDMNIIPKDTQEEHIKIYVNNIIERLAGYELIIGDWLNEMQESLNPMKKKFYYDFDKGILFLHDEDDNNGK